MLIIVISLSYHYDRNHPLFPVSNETGTPGKNSWCTPKGTTSQGKVVSLGVLGGRFVFHLPRVVDSREAGPSHDGRCIASIDLTILLALSLNDGFQIGSIGDSTNLFLWEGRIWTR